MTQLIKPIVISHFHQPEWPLVNKIRAIAACSGIEYSHFATEELLLEAIKEAGSWQKFFLITDEPLIRMVAEIESNFSQLEIETLLFIQTSIPEEAGNISNLQSVKFLMGSKDFDMIGKDLSILLKKINSGDILNLSKYLSYGANIKSRKITDQVSKKKVINEIDDYIISLGSPEYDHPFYEYSQRMAEVADELILNAIFNANPLMKDVDRSKSFELEKDKFIDVKWGFDGDYFGLSVTDYFGSFSRNIILKYLDSNRKLSGLSNLSSAGLGLKMIFERTHQLIINIHPGEVTEVICVTKFENRFKNNVINKSVYYFDKENS